MPEIEIGIGIEVGIPISTPIPISIQCWAQARLPPPSGQAWPFATYPTRFQTEILVYQ